MFCLESVVNCPLGIIKSSESESENSLENKNKQSDEEQVSSKCHQAQQIRNLEFCLVWTVTSCSLSHQLAAILRGHCAIIRAFIVKHYLKKKKSLPQSKSLKSFPLEVGSYFYHTCCCQILWYISRILAFFECHVSSVQRLNICQFAKILLRIFFFLFRLKNFNWIVL